MLTTKRFDDALNPKHDRHGPPEEIPYGLSCLCFALFYSLLPCFNGIGFGNWDSARYRFSFIRIASSHLIPRLCVSFPFSLLSAVFLASHAFFCFLFSLFSHAPSCWFYSATGHRPWSFALYEDKKKTKRRPTSTSRGLSCKLQKRGRVFSSLGCY